jgi:glutamine synthetase
VVRFFCSIRHPTNRFLRGRKINPDKAVREAEEMGYTCKSGSECEFYLFEVDD